MNVIFAGFVASSYLERLMLTRWIGAASIELYAHLKIVVTLYLKSNIVSLDLKGVLMSY